MTFLKEFLEGGIKFRNFIADDMAHGDMLTTWEKRSAHVPVIADQGSSKQPHDPSMDKENKAMGHKVGNFKIMV